MSNKNRKSDRSSVNLAAGAALTGVGGHTLWQAQKADSHIDDWVKTFTKLKNDADKASDDPSKLSSFISALGKLGDNYAEKGQQLFKNHRYFGFRLPSTPFLFNETDTFAGGASKGLPFTSKLKIIGQILAGHVPSVSDSSKVNEIAYGAAQGTAHMRPFFDDALSAHTPISSEIISGIPDATMTDKGKKLLEKLKNLSSQSTLHPAVFTDILSKSNVPVSVRYAPLTNWATNVEDAINKGTATPADKQLYKYLSRLLNSIYKGHGSSPSLRNIYSANVVDAAGTLGRKSLKGVKGLAGVLLAGGGLIGARELLKHKDMDKTAANDTAPFTPAEMAGAAGTAIGGGLLTKHLLENPSLRRYDPLLDSYNVMVHGGFSPITEVGSKDSFSAQAHGLTKELGKHGVHASHRTGWSGGVLKRLLDPLLDFYNLKDYDALIQVGNSPGLNFRADTDGLSTIVPSARKSMVLGRLFTDAGEGSLLKNQPIREWTGNLNGMSVYDPRAYDITLVPGYKSNELLPESVRGSRVGVGIGNIINDPMPFRTTPFNPSGKNTIVLTSGGGAGIPLLFSDIATHELSDPAMKFDINKANILDDISEAISKKYGPTAEVIWHTGANRGQDGKFLGEGHRSKASADLLNDIEDAQKTGRFRNIKLQSRLSREAIARDFSEAKHIIGLPGSTLAEIANMPGDMLPGMTFFSPDDSIQGMTGHWGENIKAFKNQAFPHLTSVNIGDSNRRNMLETAINNSSPIRLTDRKPLTSDVSRVVTELQDLIKQKRIYNLKKLVALTLLTGGSAALWKYKPNTKKESK